MKYCSIITILLGCTALSGAEFIRVCYYTNWSQYRNFQAKFTIDNIDPTLCTHFVFAFVNMTDSLLKPIGPNDVFLYQQFNYRIRQGNPAAKSILSVGGWTHGVEEMTKMLTTNETRNTFIQSAISYLRIYNFDGFDLDFEFPGHRGSPPDDKDRFASLCEEMSEAFRTEHEASGNARLLLSVAVSAAKSSIQLGYHVQRIADAVDHVHLMTYDLDGFNAKTAHHAALYPPPSGNGNSISVTVEAWMSEGCPAHKLVVGIPAYGRGFVLANSTQNSLDAPAPFPSAPGTYTQEHRFISYYELCDTYLGDEDTQIVRDENVTAPYLANDNTWIAYDDPISVRAKVEWINDKGLGGWMLWSLDLDDFSGHFCGWGSYPLLRAMNHDSPGAPTMPPPTAAYPSNCISEGCTIMDGLSPCVNHMCMHNTQCVPCNTTYTCCCAPGYTGRYCENRPPIIICDRRPCRNNGRCTPDDVTGYKCNCPLGYTGRRCDVLDTEVLNSLRKGPNEASRLQSPFILILSLIMMMLVR